MFTYETRAALADEHQSRMLAQAEQSRRVRTALGLHRRPAWLSRLGFPSPAGRSRVVPDRRLQDRRVAKVPVLVERRSGHDRRVPATA